MKIETVCQTTEAQNHKQDIEALVVSGDRLFTAADDGFIKVWSLKDLQLLHEFQAHEYVINDILVSGDRLYTASNDQTIKYWQLDTWAPVDTFYGHEETPRKLATDGYFLFSGDDDGEVIKWTKDGKIVARYRIFEEMWDLHIQNSHIYTVQDRGLAITEMIKGSTDTPLICTIEGRAPFYIHNDDLVMVDTSGVILNHYRKRSPSYDFVQTLKGHESIVTTMTGWKEFLVTSGLDEKMFVWNLRSGELLSSFPLKGCPAAIYATENGHIFLGCSDRSVLKLSVSS